MCYLWTMQPVLVTSIIVAYYLVSDSSKVLLLIANYRETELQLGSSRHKEKFSIQ